MGFKVKFWGVRGSIACPSSKYAIFGGNTSCIEVSCGGQRVILDCGTGIRNLGHWMMKKGVRQADILMSHTHWDHINGFPFFSPAYQPDHEFRIMAGHLFDIKENLSDIMAGQMNQPTFPVPIQTMRSKLTFEDFVAGDSFTLGNEIKVKTTLLRHPDNATGYRIDYGGKSFCYVTDTEHIPGKPDENILNLIDHADVVVYDCTYTDREFPSRIGWGHSTWQEGMRLCKLANAKRLVIFHHDPDHEDPFLELLEAEARMAWDGALMSRENMRLNLA